MKFLKLLIILFFILFNTSCSGKKEKENIILENDIESQMLESYNEALKALNEGDVLYAAKKFNEVEILFPQSDLASKSNLMAAYAYYSQDYYYDTIEELKIFIRKYPNHKNIDYAHYLTGIAYYDQIVDEKKDLNSVLKAKEKFEFVVKEYPNTDYAIDSKFKIDLVNDILASKEIYLGRYYFQKKKWIASINRFKNVINKYDTTIYAEEALHRLVEIHYNIGLVDEAKKYASLLGYNYQSSKWYEMSYSIFDQKYKKKVKQKKENNIVIKKFKSLFE